MKERVHLEQRPPIAGIDRSDPETQIDAARGSRGADTTDILCSLTYYYYIYVDQCILQHCPAVITILLYPYYALLCAADR